MKKPLFWIVAIMMLIMTSCAMMQDFQEFRESKKNEKQTENVPETEIVDNLDEVTYDDIDSGAPANEYAEDYVENDTISQDQSYYDNSELDIVGESEELVEKIDDVESMPGFDDSEVNTCNYPPGYVPSFSDEVYKKRFDTLRMSSTINFVYRKEVKPFIDLYAVKKREHTERILGLADYYFPIFETALDKYNLPYELKCLAIVESALNNTAVSRVSAKGLWQFMYQTGKLYGLTETTLYDDRYDVLKATDAACRHLRDLYNMFDDWYLALAAYNSGPGNVKKAIRRAGGIKDYWAILPYLPRETRGYVPAFIAVNYVVRYKNEHNLCPIDPGIIVHGTDTVTVHDLLHFDQINEMLGVPMEDLVFFNPQYKAQIIPATAKKPMTLILPEKYVYDFIDHEKELYAFKTKKGIERAKLEEQIKNMSDRSVHIVKKGETLSVIAKKYHISVKQLKSWNNLKSDNLKIGQKLVLYSPGGSSNQSQASSSNNTNQTVTTKVHVVKKGESLDKISKMYKCSVADLKKWNNLKSNTINIGQKLKVCAPDNQSSSSNQNSSSNTTYTVKKGDSLWTIAKKHNVTVDYIKKKNNLKTNDLKVGQKLKL